jgi:hypothetical protein
MSRRHPFPLLVEGVVAPCLGRRGEGFFLVKALSRILCGLELRPRVQGGNRLWGGDFLVASRGERGVAGGLLFHEAFVKVEVAIAGAGVSHGTLQRQLFAINVGCEFHTAVGSCCGRAEGTRVRGCVVVGM